MRFASATPRCRFAEDHSTGTHREFLCLGTLAPIATVSFRKGDHMPDHNATRGVHVSSGEGIVAHLSNLTAFAAGDETRLNELLVRLNALKDAPWHEVVRTLTAGIAESNYDAHPDLACVSIGDDRVAALVFGDTSLTIATDQSKTTLNGRDSSTWIDVAIHGVVDRVHAGVQSDSVLVGVLRDGVVPAGGFLLDTSGPMPSSTRWIESVSALEATSPPPVPVTEPVAETEPAAEALPEPTVDQQAAPVVAPQEAQGDTPADERNEQRSLAGIFARLDNRYRPDPPQPTEEVQIPEVPDVPERLAADASLPDDGDDPGPGEHGPTSGDQTPAFGEAQSNGSTPESAATPSTSNTPSSPTTLAPVRRQLRGIRCPDGHLTNANDVVCRSCGLATTTDAEIVMGDRPVLGQLTFDDGAMLSIDRPAAIGSDVPAGYEVDGEPATIVRLDDGLNGVSAIQVEVRTMGWDVEVHDMNSPNGTYTVLRGERQTRTRLRAGQSVVLQDGMVVEVGGRSFTYSLGSSAA